jgi:hypothetical protein
MDFWCPFVVVWDDKVRFFYMVKGPAADVTDAPQPKGFLCNPLMKMKTSSFFLPRFTINGAPVE